MTEQVTDALGQPIAVGNWYGYSRSDSGWSHVVIGQAKSTNDKGKVRLVDCRVKRYLYGKPTDYRVDEKPADVSMRGDMVFPVPNQEVSNDD